MKRCRTLPLLCGGLATLLALNASPVSGQDTVATSPTTVLVVMVANGTPNGASTVDDPVTVDIYRENELIDTLQGRVGPEGNTVFPKVPVGQHLVAAVVCKHQKVAFEGQAIPLNPSRGHLIARVQVYDVSSDNAELSVSTHHIIIKPAAGSVLVSEYMRLTNSANRAISAGPRDDSGKPAVLTVMLPPGHKNFQTASYFHRDALVFTQDGFYDTMAVAPGKYHVQFSYTLDITDETMEFVKRFSLATNDLILFIAIPDAQAIGVGSPTQFTLSDGMASDYYSLGPQKPGEELRFQLAGLKVPRIDRSWLIMAVVFGCVGMLVIWRMWSRGKTPQ